MMTRLEAVKQFLGKNPTTFDQIIKAFQLGNEHIYTDDADQISSAYGLTHSILEATSSSMSRFFQAAAITPGESAVSFCINDSKAFVCAVTNPVPGVSKDAFALVIGKIEDTNTYAEGQDGKQKPVSNLRPVFVLTADIIADCFFPQEARFLLESKEESYFITHKEKPLSEFWPQYLCYADSAFTSILLGETVDCEECQRWFHPDSKGAARERHDYIVQREPAELSLELMEVKEELDKEASPFPMPPRYQ